MKFYLINLILIFGLISCSNNFGANYYECLLIYGKSGGDAKAVKDSCNQVHPSRPASDVEAKWVEVDVYEGSAEITHTAYLRVENRNKNFIITEIDVVLRPNDENSSDVVIRYELEVKPFSIEWSDHLRTGIKGDYTVLDLVIRGREFK